MVLAAVTLDCYSVVRLRLKKKKKKLKMIGMVEVKTKKLEQLDFDKGPHIIPCSENGIAIFGGHIGFPSSDDTHIQTRARY